MNETHIELQADAGRCKRLLRFLVELRQRRVGRAATTYALVLWLNLQVADVGIPLLGLPDWSMAFILTLGLLGFPLVVALAWIFQITPHGIVVDTPLAAGAEERHRSGSTKVRLDAALLALGMALITLTTVQLAAETVVHDPLLGSPPTTHEPAAGSASGISADPIVGLDIIRDRARLSCG